MNTTILGGKFGCAPPVSWVRYALQLLRRLLWSDCDTLAHATRGTAVKSIAAVILLTILGATGSYGSEPLGFGGVLLGDGEAEVRSVFPNVDCRRAEGLKSPYRCFVKALAWGVPTGAWFLFDGDEDDRSVAAIVLAFKPQYYGQVLPRLVLEFGQPTEQRGASLFWKVGKAGVILRDLGKGQDFRVFMTTDAAIDRSAR
jgi:hypothetical protein